MAKLTRERLKLFCEALAESCNVGKACKAASITRQTAYAWKREHPAFEQAWREALNVGLSVLEDEAHRRAFEGSDKPVYHLGQQVGKVREYSDTLAIFLLKAHDPEKYRENSRLELSGHLDVRRMDDTDLDAEIAALTAKLGAIGSAAPPAANGADDDSGAGG